MLRQSRTSLYQWQRKGKKPSRHSRGKSGTVPDWMTGENIFRGSSGSFGQSSLQKSLLSDRKSSKRGRQGKSTEQEVNRSRKKTVAHSTKKIGSDLMSQIAGDTSQTDRDSRKGSWKTVFGSHAKNRGKFSWLLTIIHERRGRGRQAPILGTF